MTEEDIYVGFEKEPADLEGFLEKQGYSVVSDEDDDILIYEHATLGCPSVFYYSPIVELSDADKENGCLDWGKSGYKVVSELDITFPPDDINATLEAVRLSKEIVRGLDGILYDSHLDEFFRKDGL